MQYYLIILILLIALVVNIIDRVHVSKKYKKGSIFYSPYIRRSNLTILFYLVLMLIFISSL